MLKIGMTVKVLPNAEYGGKYTGCVGVVKNYYSSKKKAGVELEKVQNDASSKGLFWFSEDKLTPVETPYFWESLNESLSKIVAPPVSFRCSFNLHRTEVPPVKKVIFSGPKTIVLWADGTKTIVSCGAGDTYDYYAGFCAAVVKKLFGSTTHAKKVLGEVVQVQ
uniref:PROTEIN I, ELECTRON TRANSPORT n=1 Tax=Siphoviridae sp. ct3es5 TaxID=2825322 RepID=A0A8S5PV48_9CAUD|nr:MAG TPA: PROTEIN I, ELECTRON TRANSPORT [Siphoviridae sp. ct3es5]